MNFLTKYIHRERLIHGVKTATACLLSLLLAEIVGLPAVQWIVITVIVVMCAQIYVGGVLQKAYLRFLGTLIGCLFAILTLLTFGDTPTAIFATIALSSFFFSYFATRQENLAYAGTLGAVTTAIIMLGQTPTLLFAVERFLEISLGLLIATLISQFFLPIHASTHLRRAQAKTLAQLRDYYAGMMTLPKTTTVDYPELDEQIVKSLMQQRQLAKDSTREPFKREFNVEQFIELLFYERDMLRAITFMQHAFSRIDNIAGILEQSSAFQAFNRTIIDAFNVLITVLEKTETKDVHIHLPNLNLIRDEIKLGITQPRSDEILYLDGFLFSAEILANDLQKIGELYHLSVLK